MRLSWKQRIMIAALVGLSGSFYVAAMSVGGAVSIFAVVLAGIAAVGAFFAGMITAAGFGRPGKYGWLWSIFSYLASTALGAFLAAFFIPIDSFFLADTWPEFIDGALGALRLAFIAPLLIAWVATDNHLVIVVWVVSLIALHGLAKKIRETDL